MSDGDLAVLGLSAAEYQICMSNALFARVLNAVRVQFQAAADDATVCSTFFHSFFFVSFLEFFVPVLVFILFLFVFLFYIRSCSFISIT